MAGVLISLRDRYKPEDQGTLIRYPLGISWSNSTEGDLRIYSAEKLIGQHAAGSWENVSLCRGWPSKHADGKWEITE